MTRAYTSSWMLRARWWCILPRNRWQPTALLPVARWATSRWLQEHPIMLMRSRLTSSATRLSIRMWPVRTAISIRCRMCWCLRVIWPKWFVPMVKARCSAVCSTVSVLLIMTWQPPRTITTMLRQTTCRSLTLSTRSATWAHVHRVVNWPTILIKLQCNLCCHTIRDGTTITMVLARTRRMT